MTYSRPQRPQSGRLRRRGTILIVTMWIILVLAGLVLVLARAMRVEATCSANELSALQAEAVEQGAVQYVLASLDGLAGEMPDEDDMPCEAVRVGGGAFWILRPNFDDERTLAYGVVDEASKLSLNTASAATLLKLPGMTDELSACIVDWRDGDADVTTGGAESEYYLLLDDPYHCKDAPLESVEELMLVKGATTEILFGEDVNRNGILDDNENDGDVSEPADDLDGRLDRGILPFVTVHSVEPNTDGEGEARVNVNTAQNQALRDLFRDSMSQDRIVVVLDRVRRERPFRNILDFHFRVGLTIEEFRPIADRLTTSTAQVQRGLVNVATAPKEVLLCLGGLEEADVSALLAKRAEANVDLTNLAWVAEVLSRQKAVAAGDFMTARTVRYLADIVSVSGDGRAFKRCRIVVDAQNSPPKVIFRRDLTHLGWPLAAETLATLRAGGSIEDLVQDRTITQEVPR